MEKNPTWLLVVAALIRDGAGRLLLQQALPGKPHSGFWEFPGGKVESEENPRVALSREIAEELGIELKSAAMVPVGVADEPGRGSDPAIVLVLYDCPTWQSDPFAREGQVWNWFTPVEAAALPVASMDRRLLEALLG